MNGSSRAHTHSGGSVVCSTLGRDHARHTAHRRRRRRLGLLGRGRGRALRAVLGLVLGSWLGQDGIAEEVGAGLTPGIGVRWAPTLLSEPKTKKLDILSTSLQA